MNLLMLRQGSVETSILNLLNKGDTEYKIVIRNYYPYF